MCQLTYVQLAEAWEALAVREGPADEVGAVDVVDVVVGYRVSLALCRLCLKPFAYPLSLRS